MLENIRNNFVIIFCLIVSLASTGTLVVSYSSVNAIVGTSHVSVEEYDKIKNCVRDLSKRPSSIEYLTYFNCGHVFKTNDNQTLREFSIIVEENQKIPISYQGHIHQGWTFNGTIPGPTIRVTEGDLVRIKVINSELNQHAHSLHTHSIHSAQVDGVSMGGYAGGAIPPGGSFVYEFIAQPYGVYPYHCHVEPLADHINRGLYGMLIIDPKQPRPQMTEFAMLMNGYDLNYDQEGPTTIPVAETTHKSTSKSVLSDENPDATNNQDHEAESSMNNKESRDARQTKQGDNDDDTPAEKNKAQSDTVKAEIKSNEDEQEEERDNEIYTVNGKAFDYMMHPISMQAGKPYRIYLINMLEFDLINSFHMHGTMFNYITAGTDEKPDYKTDIVTLSQGDRGIIEFQFNYPGKYMFHAHVTEFTDLGWMGLFNVKPIPTLTKCFLDYGIIYNMIAEVSPEKKGIC